LIDPVGLFLPLEKRDIKRNARHPAIDDFVGDLRQHAAVPRPALADLVERGLVDEDVRDAVGRLGQVRLKVPRAAVVQPVLQRLELLLLVEDQHDDRERRADQPDAKDELPLAGVHLHRRGRGTLARVVFDLAGFT
jgi:hypothetical protein